MISPFHSGPVLLLLLENVRSLALTESQGKTPGRDFWGRVVTRSLTNNPSSRQEIRPDCLEINTNQNQPETYCRSMRRYSLRMHHNQNGGPQTLEVSRHHVATTQGDSQ